MTSSWDTMLAKDDAELVAEIKADTATCVMHMHAGNVAACVAIEKKYGLYGSSTQDVLETLRQMALPIQGGVT